MISDIQKKIKNKEITCVELTGKYLDRIEKLNPDLNAYITVSQNYALEQAKNLDAEITKSDDVFIKKPLFGIPIGLKDIYSTKDIKTTAGSNILKDYISPYDATVVNKLKNAGAIILGKLNCDAFAHGGTGFNSDFGFVKNPYNKNYSAGGSSSGSGAAVAADMAVIGTGTDTGGSLRNPASLTNTVAIKPTYGRVSRYGIIAMASSLDSIGHIGKTVEDTAMVLQVTAGQDKYDATTSDNNDTDYLSSINQSVSGLKIGIPKEYMELGVSKEVEQIFQNTVDMYKRLGAEIVDISMPHSKYAIAVYYIIVPAEISSNLGRFDGIRFGHNRSAFGAEAKRRIMIGTHVLSSGFYDEYYAKAQKVRSLIANDFRNAYEKVDLILSPVIPDFPPKLGENINDPIKNYVIDMLTAPANLSGIPALSVPAGFDSKGIPVGVQIMGKHFDEKLLFRAGKAIENEMKLYERSPEL